MFWWLVNPFAASLWGCPSHDRVRLRRVRLRHHSADLGDAGIGVRGADLQEEVEGEAANLGLPESAWKSG